MAGETNKVVIVTGGSSGIGRCTASALKENGCIVYEFSRRNIPMEGVTHLSVDVTDEDAVNAAVQQVIQKETKIDAVINCAGFGISGAVEFTSLEQAKAQFDVNFFGTVTVNKAVLPFLRRQGKGHIVNISSVAAVGGACDGHGRAHDGKSRPRRPQRRHACGRYGVCLQRSSGGAVSCSGAGACRVHHECDARTQHCDPLARIAR